MNEYASYQKRFHLMFFCSADKQLAVIGSINNRFRNLQKFGSASRPSVHPLLRIGKNLVTHHTVTHTQREETFSSVSFSAVAAAGSGGRHSPLLSTTYRHGRKQRPPINPRLYALQPRRCPEPASGPRVSFGPWT